jgi:glycosyltransferase involved in cell wall biosynthesis
MSSVDFTIIIPTFNLEHEIPGIIRSTANQCSNICAEFLVVDMGSTDHSVFSALSTIKEMKLHGCVIQTGQSTIGAAFNAGINKASGKYITFLFPRRLYRDHLLAYWKVSQDYGGDLIFGTTAESKGLAKAEVKKLNGADLVYAGIWVGSGIDIGAVMINKRFLIQNHLFFHEECTFGFSEEFLLRVMLSTDEIYRSPCVMKRDAVFEVPVRAVKPVGNVCFERIEAMKRIEDLLIMHHKANKQLMDAFRYEKLPDVVLSCVDLLLKEGYGYNAIRGMLRVNGYDTLLIAGKPTSAKLRRQIRLWKTLPWMYRPRIV